MQGYDPTDDLPQPPPGLPAPGPGMTLGQAPQAPPPAQSPTLGDVAPQTMSATQYLAAASPQALPGGAGAVPGSNPYLQEYAQAFQAARQMLDPVKMGYVHPPSQTTPGHLLGNILTGGLLALRDHDQAQIWNNRADTYNRGIDMKAANLAQQMVNSKSKGGLEDLGMQLRVLTAQLQVNQEVDRKNNAAWAHAVKSLHAAPTSPQEEDMLRAQGLGPMQHYPGWWGRPEQDVPIEVIEPPTLGLSGHGLTVTPGAPRQKLQPQPNGGWGLGQPAAPGSAADNAGLGPGGATGGQGTGGGRPPDMLPGESAGDYTRRKARKATAQTAEDKAKITATVPTAMTRNRAEAAQNVLDTIDAVEHDITQTKLGPLRSPLTEAKIALGGSDPAYAGFKADLKLLSSKLQNMHIGARGSDQMTARFDQMLRTNNPENLRAVLSRIRKYATEVKQSGDVEAAFGKHFETSTTETTTSTTTPSTSGGVSTGLDDILRKHGY